MITIGRVTMSRKAFGVKKFMVICNSPECLCVNIWGFGLIVDRNKR